MTGEVTQLADQGRFPGELRFEEHETKGDTLLTTKLVDHHGPPKVNFWGDPMSPSKWKEEHFVIVSLTGWGLLFYGGYKFFTKGNNNKKEEHLLYRSH
ncbi:hypothetical protein FCV25MIE_26973 [Fagus crenata]